MGLTRCSWLMVGAAVAGCSFEAIDGAEEAPETPGTPTTSETGVCNAKVGGAVLCIEFEDSLDDLVASDALRGNHAALVEVTATPLSGERWAQLHEASSAVVNEAPALDLRTFTIELRVAPGKQVPSKEAVGLFENHGQFAMFVDDDQRVRCSLGGRDDARSAVDLVHGMTPTHVACTYDGTEMRVYMNGALSGCSTLRRTVSIAGTIGSTIGSRRDAAGLRDRLVGRIDYVRVYDQALTPADLCTATGIPAASCATTCPVDTYDDDLR